MIRYLIKQWELLLEIILVIGLILGFTFWDPFHIFTNSELQATSNLVTGVRDIGQLVTTEYYGEVISSWKEFKLTRFPEDTVTSYASDLYLELKHTLYKVPNRRKVDEAVTQFKREHEIEPELYNKFIAFLSTRFLNARLERVYDKNGDLKGNYEDRILKKLYSQIERESDRLKKNIRITKNGKMNCRTTSTASPILSVNFILSILT